MKKGKLVALSATMIVLAALPFIPGLLEAATSVLTLDGHILTVGITEDPYTPSIQGLVLYDQAPSGTSAGSTATVRPGTSSPPNRPVPRCALSLKYTKCGLRAQ